MTADIRSRFFPEAAAGGFTRVDGTIEFYTRINALLRPEMRVLDFGAGRAEWAHDDAVIYRRELRRLQGKVAAVVACDVDPAVLHNPAADETVVIDSTGALPFADESFDLVIADFVFEHLVDAEQTARELQRILRPGGWIAARTPNRYGYVAIVASLVKNSNHWKWLRKVQPHRKRQDVFPTTYALNTPKRIRRAFPAPVFSRSIIYGSSAEPAYAGNSMVLWTACSLLHKLLPAGLQTALLVFLRKNGP